MKNLILKLTLLTCLISSVVQARNLGTEGHGGDEMGLDVQRSMAIAVGEIHQADVELFKKITRKELEELIMVAKIVIVDQNLPVLIDGVQQASVATNDPATKIIYVHRQRWKEISESRLKQAIALHELLSLVKLEDTGFYPYSGPYLIRFGLNQEAIATGVVANTQQTSPGGAKFQTAKCSETTMVIERATQKRYVIEADKVEGSITWAHDGEGFDFSFGGIEFDAVSNRSYLMMTRFREENDSLGRLARLHGTRQLETFVDSKFLSSEGAVDSRYEYLNSEESIGTSYKDGQATSFTTRVISRRLQDGQKLNIQQVQNIDNPNDMFIVESQVRTCTSRDRNFAEASTFYPAAILKVAQNFDTLIAQVTSLVNTQAGCLEKNLACEKVSSELNQARARRDLAWKKLVDAKSFLAQMNSNDSKGVSEKYKKTRNEKFGNQRRERDRIRTEFRIGTKYRDRFGRPIYKDSFGDFHDEKGFPEKAKDVKDEWGRPICEDVFHRSSLQCL